MLKVCETCKISFDSKRSSQKYCGKSCQTEGQRKTEVRTCIRDGCAVDFEIRPSDLKVYCSRSCAVKVNNVLAPKRTPEGLCALCNAVISSQRTYCVNCGTSEKRDKYIQDWLAGNTPGGSVRKISSIVRGYLLAKANMSCEICGFNTPHPVDGKTILEIDHIDGDGDNHRPDNLRVLCPNCHSLTPTYRGRNKGSGRKVFYVRIEK